MKKTKFGLFAVALLPVFMMAENQNVVASQGQRLMASQYLLETNPKDTSEINATEWMKYLSDDIKITDINIPGAHDAATYHTSAGPVIDLYTNCQSLMISKQSYTTKRAFKADTTTTEDGLLERGVRYLDIRYNLQDTEIPETDVLAYNSARLKLAHSSFTAQYKTVDNCVLPDKYETTDNEKLMTWCKDFLSEHPSETIILDLMDENDKETQEYATKFFTELAKHPSADYPEIYDATNKGVPTLGEVRGKVVLLSNFSYDDSNFRKNVGYGNAYTFGDESVKNYGLAYRDEARKTCVYKNNAYNFNWAFKDGDALPLFSTTSAKVEWVNNGLMKADEYKARENANGYDPFMLLYTNANSIGNGNLIDTIKDYAKKVNPAAAKTIKEQGQKFYGIVAMDFMDDKDIEENMSAIIWQTNFDIPYAY